MTFGDRMSLMTSMFTMPFDEALLSAIVPCPEPLAFLGFR